MKKNYFLILLLFFAFLVNAQTAVQKKNAATFDAIQYWVGTGSNQAAFVVQWNDSKNSDALIWGFRWDGEATGEDMLKAILKADHRLYSLLYQGAPGAITSIGGLGYDLNGTKTKGLYKGVDLTFPFYPANGIINTKAYDFDNYTVIDTDDHWQSGWTNGKWSYWLKNAGDADFTNSNLEINQRILQNGSWDVWNYKPNNVEIPVSATFIPVTPYVIATDFTNGFFMVNEEWFGHTNGSVNFVNYDGTINYRVYSAVNNNEAFGATTQNGTIYGNKFYFISKQAKDGGDTNYTPGGRLVVANAQNLQRIAKFDVIGGDGRSFLGVNETTGYIGASNGIYLFDIANMKVGSLITGTSGQIGNMIRTSQYVFAVKQSTGILVIDPNTNTVIKTIAGAFNSIAQAKDGSVWGIQAQKLINIDAITFATTEYAIPATRYDGSWGAWNAGSFTYSNQQNALYWINSINAFNSGKQIIKFDVTAKTFNENFAAIPGQTGTYKQIPYGAALRIDPVADNLILNTSESGFGAHSQKNWIHTFDATGSLIDTKTLDDYYWFPAITVFPDNISPVVSAALPSQVSINSATVIDLKNIVSDADNLSVAIVKTIQSNSDTEVVSAIINTNDELVLTPEKNGEATVVIRFNSNGKWVEKSIAITASTTLGTDDFKKLELGIYPNPATDILNIKTQDELRNVTIYDISGKILNTRVSNNQVDVSAFVKGIYIINITTENANYVQKFIKN